MDTSPVLLFLSFPWWGQDLNYRFYCCNIRHIPNINSFVVFILLICFLTAKISIFALDFGTLFFVSALWYAESIYPKYDIFQNYISDLGVGTAAFIFNNAIMLAGFFLIIISFLLFKQFKDKLFLSLLAVTGIGAFMLDSSLKMQVICIQFFLQ